MRHMGTKRIETKRLTLRPFRPEDAHDMFINWASDPKVTRFLTWPTYTSEDDAVTYCTARAVLSDTPEIYEWIIECKENGQAIGTVSAANFREKFDTCELGYCLSSKYWHCGFMTEAVSAVISYLFDQVDVWRIGAMHDVNNPASGQVMKRAGMRYEGILRGYNVHGDGTHCDCAVYSILKTDER